MHPLISRRAALTSAASAVATTLAPWPLRAMNRPDLQLPLSADLDGHTLVRSVGAAGFARVERLGVSRTGRGIDLISVGRGPRAALIVGAPHSNEPIGCATIVRMLARLAGDRALREHSGWQWHFIPAIDIDGIALNEGWFRGERTLPHYLADFYRPPFRLQPEYAFPLELPGYRFDTSTPENACWRRALEHVRPQLQCSLHGADTGGSFFIVSDLRAPLGTALTGLPPAQGITLNTIGDSSANLHELGPGLFAFPDIDSLIAKAVASHRQPDQVWNAGDSSAGYSAKRFGTFNMVCEVPLWRDARERDSRSSGHRLAEVIGEQIQLVRADEHLLKPFLPALLAKANGSEAKALLASVQEAILHTDGAVEELSEGQAAPSAQRILDYRELVQYEAGTAGFRTLAMAQRLARLMNMQDLAERAGNELTTRLNRYQRSARLVPVALSAATELQIAAILATARNLSSR
ncbi:MAG: hypothetical protein JSR66_26815 [Proteobacteria bacterium]|nr:hypothetical protein [Pseudomonadota bacterium]